MIRNKAGQTLHVKAFNSEGLITGDAANITCTLAVDGGSRSSTTDTNPTEIGTSGEYEFALTQAETKGYELSFMPSSSTSGVQVFAMPGNVIYTRTVPSRASERDIDGESESPIVLIRLLDGSSEPIEDILYSDSDIDLEVLTYGGSGFTSRTLATASVGTYTENGWVHVDAGYYEYGIQASLVVPGEMVVVRVRYDSGEWQYTEVQFQNASALTTDAYTDSLPDNFADLSIEAVTGKVASAPSSVVSVDAPSADEAGRIILTQRDDYEDDSDIAPIGPIRISTSQQLLRETDPPSLRFGATLAFGNGYGNTHFIGTAYAEAVSGEANEYDLYIEIEHDELNKTPGRYGWDIEAVYADGDVSTLVRGTLDLRQSMGDHENRV